MRTTIDIPEDLLNEAMRSMGVKTKTTAIILGLRELLRRGKIENLRALRGKVNLDVDVKSSRRR